MREYAFAKHCGDGRNKSENCHCKTSIRAVNEVREHIGGELVRKQAVNVWRSFHGGFDTRIDSEHIYHVGKGHYH